MADAHPSDALERIRDVASRAPGLDLLILFGSRARGDVHARSDWDFAYLATPATDLSELSAALVEATGTDRVDLVDLRRASGLLRFRVARDGRVVYESRSGLGDEFRFDAARFWCDIAPVVGAAYEDVLARLDR